MRIIINLFIQTFPFVVLETTSSRFILHRAVDFGGRYIYPDKHEDEKHIEICSNHMDDTVKNVLIRAIIMCLSFCLA